MVFSFFGKKKGAASPKPGEESSKSAKTPAPAVPAKPASPTKPAGPVSSQAGVESGDDTSLDFTTYAPPPKSEPPPVAGTAKSTSAPASAETLRSAAIVPAGASATDSSASLRPRTATPSAKPPDSAMDAGAHAADEIAPVIEETAILFANGQAHEALGALSRSVREASVGASALQVWLMLFDLYQHLGMREEFESLGFEFTVKFERSPPVWIGAEPRLDAAHRAGSVGYFALAGALSEASAAEIDRLRSGAASRQSIRLDCGKLRSLDGPGCRLLREALLSIRASGTEVVLAGESGLVRPLQEACRPGRSDSDGAMWALLLDVYRMLGDKDEFEETAVNYAVTFEMSPPSWEAPETAAKRPAKHASAEAAERALVLSGEITGAEATLAKQLQDWAAANKMLVIDMSRVQRVDFVSAGLMLNVLSKLNQAGVTVQMRGVNALVHALFRAMRIDRVARIVARK